MAKKSGYPVKYLYQAYNVLYSQGYDAYLRFVNRVKMPTEDRERVTNKYNYHHDEKFRAKIDAKIKDMKNKLDNWAGPSHRATGF
jgi:hypothetical protein